MKLLTITMLSITTVCSTLYLTQKASYGSWEIKNTKQNNTNISWANFIWVNDSLNGKYYEKIAMNIPCNIKGLPNVFTFQFDLGATLTGVYENSYNEIINSNTEFTNNIKKTTSSTQFWKPNKCLSNFTLHFGDYIATNTCSFYYKNFGEAHKNPKASDTLHLGTIGADMFKDKVLIIDYPNKQFAILDDIPTTYNFNLMPIEIDKSGKVILPLKMQNKSYRITFDNGSSLFPLITSAKNSTYFTNAPNMDTIQVSSWGKLHNVTGALIKDSFEIGGKKIKTTKVYTNHSSLGLDANTDATAGNALFWNSVIVIDFKNKKFGAT